ncbi:MAG: hypothetical protein WBM54_13885 [Woeseia sp.]
MSTKLNVALLTITGILISGCAGAVASRAIPDKGPLQCQVDEQLVCTGKTATRIDSQSKDMEFCRCERVDRIH